MSLKLYSNLVRVSWIITWTASTFATVLLFRSCRSGFALLASLGAGSVLATWIIEVTVFWLRRFSGNPFLESVVFRVNGSIAPVSFLLPSPPRMAYTSGKSIAPQMNIVLCFVILIVATGSRASADGYPFDPASQELLIDSLRVRLSGEQVESLSSTGIVTFTEAQLSLIRPFYPKANAKQSVIATTFNDNHEGLSDEDVDVFWTAAEEVAITLNPKVLSDSKLKGSALADTGHPAPSDIRIAPDGRILIEGRQSTMKEAIALIDRRSREPGTDHRQVNICVAPPYRLLSASEMDAAVERAFTALAKHGENVSIVVTKSW